MVLTLFIVTILSAFLGSFWLKKKKQQVAEVIKKAQLERDLENYSKSLALYEIALNQDRRNPYLHHEYGEIKMATKNYEDAISSFSNAIAIKSDYQPVYLRRAHAYIQVGDYRKALEDCNHVINNEEFSSIPLAAYLIRGTVFIYLRRFERALSEFNIALRLKPDFFLVHTCRAEAYCYLGKYEQALESIQRAFELYDDLEITYLWRGWANYGLSKFEEALDDCNRYLQRDKEAPKAFEVRGLIHKSTNNLDYALADLEQAAKLYKKQKLHSFYAEVQKHIQEITGKQTDDRTKS